MCVCTLTLTCACAVGVGHQEITLAWECCAGKPSGKSPLTVQSAAAPPHLPLNWTSCCKIWLRRFPFQLQADVCTGIFRLHGFWIQCIFIQKKQKNLTWGKKQNFESENCLGKKKFLSSPHGAHLPLVDKRDRTSVHVFNVSVDDLGLKIYSSNSYSANIIYNRSIFFPLFHWNVCLIWLLLYSPYTWIQHDTWSPHPFFQICFFMTVMASCIVFFSPSLSSDLTCLCFVQTVFPLFVCIFVILLYPPLPTSPLQPGYIRDLVSYVSIGCLQA